MNSETVNEMKERRGEKEGKTTGEQVKGVGEWSREECIGEQKMSKAEKEKRSTGFPSDSKV